MEQRLRPIKIFVYETCLISYIPYGTIVNQIWRQSPPLVVYCKRGRPVRLRYSIPRPTRVRYHPTALRAACRLVCVKQWFTSFPCFMPRRSITTSSGSNLPSTRISRSWKTSCYNNARPRPNPGSPRTVSSSDTASSRATTRSPMGMTTRRS